jgi:hypothetical protein
MSIMQSTLLLLAAFCTASPSAQESVPASQASTAATQTTKTSRLTPASPASQLRLETMTVPSEIASTLAGINCDSAGNLYLQVAPNGVYGIRKLSPKGERMALFQPISPDLKSRIDFADYFSLSLDGEIYQNIHARERSPYVFVYKPDGSVRSVIKLSTEFFFRASKVAPFRSGTLFVSGLERDPDPDNPVMWPFEGIFSADGTLLKELHFEDDEKIHDMAASGDKRVVVPENPSSNLAATAGGAAVASDGKVYLMRRLSPAIFYSISAGGEVRRFTVDVGRDDFVPFSMHIAGNRIAVLFWKELTSEEILKVVDLEGHEIATYESPMKDGWSELGPAFACYALNPERFIFFTTMEDQKLGIITATPK